jgi:hypothetical protein
MPEYYLSYIVARCSPLERRSPIRLGHRPPTRHNYGLEWSPFKEQFAQAGHQDCYKATEFRHFDITRDVDDNRLQGLISTTFGSEDKK